MASDTDFIDVIFFGNPSKGLSTYPKSFKKNVVDFVDFESQELPINNPYESIDDDVRIIHSDSKFVDNTLSTYLIYKDLEVYLTEQSSKIDRNFGILINIKNQSISDLSTEIIAFIEDFIETEIIVNPILFNKFNPKAFEIKNFSQIQNELIVLTEKFKKSFIDEFEDFLEPMKQNKNVKEKKASLKEKLKKIPKFTALSLITLVLVYILIEPLLSLFSDSASIISNLIFFSKGIFILLLIIVGNKFYQGSSDKKVTNDNRFLAISFLVVLLLGMISFNRKALNESDTLAQLITYSIFPYKLNIDNNNSKPPSIPLICIDLSDSSNDEVDSIPEWFKKEQKSKDIFTTLNIKTDFKSIINKKVIEFDLIKMKALILLRHFLKKKKRNIKILTFGETSLEELNYRIIPKDNLKEKISELANKVVAFKNDKKDTDFYHLFEKVSQVITEENKNRYNIIILSDFLQYVKADKMNKELSKEKVKQIRKSFRKLTKYKVVFNFFHFDSKMTMNNKIIKFAVDDLQKKEIYASVNDMSSPSIKFINHQENDPFFLLYYYEKSATAIISCENIENKDDDIKLWIDHKDLSQLEKFEYSNSIKNQKYSKSKVFHSYEDTIPFSNHELIKLKREYFFPTSSEKQMYLNIMSMDNKVKYRTKIIFRSAMKKRDAKIFLSLTIFLFFWEILYFLVDVCKWKKAAIFFGISLNY